jgi:hypothetical protein
LTHLSFDRCDVTCLGVVATQLSALSALQRLQINDPQNDDSLQLASPEYSAAFGHTLGQLCQLTNLVLDAVIYQALLGTVFAAGSNLSRLQDLKIDCVGMEVDLAVMVKDLPASLTQLEMHYGTLSSSSSSGHSQQLAALQRVTLECTDVEPGVLLHMPHLTALDCSLYEVTPAAAAAALEVVWIV